MLANTGGAYDPVMDRWTSITTTTTTSRTPGAGTTTTSRRAPSRDPHVEIPRPGGTRSLTTATRLGSHVAFWVSICACW
jgi:hypothetical protein